MSVFPFFFLLLIRLLICLILFQIYLILKEELYSDGLCGKLKALWMNEVLIKINYQTVNLINPSVFIFEGPEEEQEEVEGHRLRGREGRQPERVVCRGGRGRKGRRQES